MSGPLLTAQEKEMCCSMQPNILQMGRYTYKDCHGRIVILTSKDADTRLSFSSYVSATLSDDLTVVGRTEFFFKHTFCGVSNTYALVHWFNFSKRETESGLWFVDHESTSSFNPLISVCKLTGPIVTAVDRDRPSKLWILSDVFL